VSDGSPPAHLTVRSPVEQYEPPTPIRDDLAIRRETMRGRIAVGLLVLLAATVVGIFFVVAIGRLPGEALIQGVFPSLVGLAGAATGYYFGSQSRSDG